MHFASPRGEKSGLNLILSGFSALFAGAFAQAFGEFLQLPEVRGLDDIAHLLPFLSLINFDGFH